MPRKISSSTPQQRFEEESTVDSRTPFQIDRDRILYSSNFARLAETTQVVSPERGYVFHNRLTHSLKVGQIARRLAERLNRDYAKELAPFGLIDPDAAESAGLAHDLGHPPFGHIAEEELDVLVKEAGVQDGFEGNAQSFRIVTRLASGDARSPDYAEIPGLNLTRLTLDGILKYPWGHRKNPKYPRKWGFYESERKIFEWVRKSAPAPQGRSLIAEVMDWADDITFAIHDLQDFYCAGRIPIDRCKSNQSQEKQRLLQGIFQRKQGWKKEEALYVEALDAVVEAFPFEPDQTYQASVADRAKLYAFATGLIRTFLSAFTLQFVSSNGVEVRIDPDARRRVEVLKQFIWQYVIENPELALPQSGQREAVRTVFHRLLAAVRKGKLFLLPKQFQSIAAEAKKDEHVRLVADCVAGMTEKELVHTYRCLQGLA